MFPGIPSGQEIGDRQQIAEALRQSEAKFRTLTETTASAIFIYQGERFCYVNPATISLTGYSRDELSRMDIWDLIHPDFHEVIRSRGLARQHAKPVPVRYEFKIITHQGKERWIDFTGGAIEYQGEPAILGTAFDITDRKMVEQALRESEENYRTLVENIPIGVYRNTPGPEGKYLMGNPAFLNMFGFESEEDLHAYSVADTYVDRSQRKIFSDNLLSQGSLTGVELQLKRTDGTTLWGSVTARVVRHEDTEEVAYFDCSIEDITERKLAEEALRRQADELARLHVLSLDISAAANTLPDLLKVIVTRAARLLDAPFSDLLLCDPKGQDIRLEAVSDPAFQDFVGARIDLGTGIAGTVAETGLPLLVSDYGAWEGVPAEFEQEQSFKAVNNVPLIWQSRVMGVLQVWDESSARKFEQPDLELLTLFANQAAIAIVNAQLREAERNQLLLARTLQDVGALLTSQLSLDEVLESILDLLGRVVQYDSASIQLVAPGDVLELSAGRGFPDLESARDTVRELSPHILERDWAGQKIAVIHDTRDHSDWVVTPGTEYIRSWIGAALLVKGRFIGILNLDSCTVGAYDQSTGETVLAFANQAAIAIENARLFEVEERRVAQLESLRQASLSLTSSLDLQAVLDTILKSTLELLPTAQVAHIFLYDLKDQGHLDFGAALWSDGRRGEPIALPRPNGLTYTVARTGESVIVPDMRSHPLYQDAPEAWHGSIVGLPLKIGDRVVGVMNIASSQSGAFIQDDLSVLRLLSDQAAVAIENARLFEQAATERRHLGLLYDIGRELQASLEPDEILDRAITLTCEALHGKRGEAFLYQPEMDDRLSLRAVHSDEPREVEILFDVPDLKIGKGLTGWVCQHRQPVIVPDIRRDSRWLPITEPDKNICSALVAPILQEDRLLGALMVLHHLPNAFTGDHLELLQAICYQVGLALTNAGRYQQVQGLADMLTAEQYRLESLMEHLPAGVLLLDANYQLMVANSLGREILSLFKSETRGQSLKRLGPYEIGDLIARHSSPLPVEIPLKGNPKRMFEAEARPLGEEPPQWVITVREVTEERENQVRVQMQERLATVGQLAAGIAHDFNNIMAAIMVYTDLLERDLESLPAGKERLNIIQQQVRRAASLIRQILDFSRRSVMEQSTLDVLPFIKELDRLLERLLPETIRLELIYQPGTYLIKADPTRLQQVFMNLAVNARDAMPDGGILSFEIARLKLGPDDPPPVPELDSGDWIQITVKDTGVGIRSKDFPHIFEPFYSTKPYGEGTGLGLAQAYGIIKQHGGHIDVHSRINTGTSFIIYLPALPVSSDQNLDLKDASPVIGEGELILLVEDDHITRDALQSMLEAYNYRVIIAANGVEAMKIYEKHGEGIALVVSDVVMPEMGGVDLYHALCERWPDVKMLFITGHPLNEDDQALLEQGRVHWLQKPFSVSEFNQVIKGLITQTAV